MFKKRTTLKILAKRNVEGVKVEVNEEMLERWAEVFVKRKKRQ